MIFYASEPHYAQHLRPIAEAMGMEVDRGLKPPQVDEPVVVASRKDAIRVRRAILIEHGSGQWYGRDAGSDAPAPNVILFLAPNEEVARRGIRLYPNARVDPVGSPWVEYLSSLEREPSHIVMTWHWEASTVPESRSAWKHHRDGISSLRDLPVLGTAHPRMIDHVSRVYRQSGIPLILDLESAFRKASILIADNTSAMWEAAAIGIPVVVLNAPWYRRHVEFPPRFWEFADIGPQVEGPAGILPAIHEITSDDRWGGRRREAAERIYGEIEGATRRAVGAITAV